MNKASPYNIAVKVETQYIEAESRPEDDFYVFAYHITITNKGEISAKLLTRHWIITDSNGSKQEVKGDGVIGKQPLLKPNETFRYTSGTMMETPIGTMEGSYQMLADDGKHFNADIPVFLLALPNMLH
jgi:ApaG protein